MFKSYKNTTKGFTLIELLVVIAIIGILSSVVLASLSTARQKSRDAKRISDVGQLQLALELYFDANQGYPPNPAAGCTAPQLCTVAAAAASLAPTYMPKIPTPSAGTTWTTYGYIGLTGTPVNVYGGVASSTAYVLSSQLERTDNTVLSNDTDATVATAGTLTTAFAGGNSTCAGAGTPEDCYDLKP